MSEWISVKDRMPKKGEPILICISYNYIFTAYWDGSLWMCQPHPWHEWEATFQSMFHVTHWMPVPDKPEPPK